MNQGAQGGCVAANNVTQLAFTNTQMVSNTAENGGGIYISGCTEMVAYNVTMRNNTASSSGGGIFQVGTRSLHTYRHNSIHKLLEPSTENFQSYLVILPVRSVDFYSRLCLHIAQPTSSTLICMATWGNCVHGAEPHELLQSKSGCAQSYEDILMHEPLNTVDMMVCCPGSQPPELSCLLINQCLLLSADSVDLH